MKTSTRAMIGVLPVIAVVGWIAVARPRRHPPNAGAVAQTLFRHSTDSLGDALSGIDSALRRSGRDSLAVRAAFRNARRQYKHLEGALEFYAPALAAAFNSRRQEVDDDDAPPPATLGASGFPALEAVLWPKYDVALVDSARHIVVGMQSLVGRIRTMLPAMVVTDAQVIELTRLELARVSALGIAGFDAPLTHDAAIEAASAIDGLRALTVTYGASAWPQFGAERRQIDATFSNASSFLRRDSDFDSFNRLAFIAFYSLPASNALDSLRRAAHTTPIRIPRGWRFDAPSIFSVGAFDVAAYAPTTAPKPNAQLIALGERLFGEPTLSGNGTRSCASCHHPDRAFSDGLPRAASIAGGAGLVARNTPTLLNAAQQPAQFADERAASLEDQVLEVLRSPAEMASSAERAAATLQRDASYRHAFAQAFATDDSIAVTALRVRQTIAAYLRTLGSNDSRFDRAIHGDTLAITGEERQGFTLFMGKAGCGTCHFAPQFGGVTPPLYLSSDVEVVGTTTSPASHELDADSGRARIDHLPLHLRAFKTPSLRNAALTAPYMHNGAFPTLDDVVAFYDHGGGRGVGARFDNQTLPADSLHLSSAERHALVAFLGSLNGAQASHR